MSNLFLIPLLISSLIGGKVKDAQTNEPISGAHVQVLEHGMSSYTDSTGQYSFENITLTHFTLKVERIGYKTARVRVSGMIVPDIFLEEDTAMIESVAIIGIRGDETLPISQKTVSKQEIEKKYFGQEMPFLLNQTPSVVSYSDGGNYNGYSYFRIRGIDQTRINFTLNGVPLNDAEDQGMYFSNFTGFANSIQSLQVQRGVGTSTFGSASYGGSVNFESVSLADSNASGDVQLSYGSFGTYRASAEYKTGLLRKKFSMYGRYTLAGSNGYRYHSGNEANSFFMSGAYFGKKSVLKLTAFSGNIKNQLAYVPVAATDIVKDPRTNYLSPSEKDEFSQQFFQLLYTGKLNENLKLTASAYYIRLAGGYDVLIKPSLYNFAVKSDFVGGYLNTHYEKDKLKIILGANASAFRRDHFMSIRPFTDSLMYFNSGYKNEVSAFSKFTYTIQKLEVYVDLQGRFAQFNYHPDKNYNLDIASVSWAFFNPKVGFTYKVNPKTSLYSSFGRTGREPTRNDMFAGFDDIDTSNASFVGKLNRVKPEYVTDLEAGVYVRSEKMYVQANLYQMNFRNEIAAIGQLSYIGLPLRKNVASSFRQGIEFDIRWKAIRRLTISQMLTLSRNRIKEYTSDTDLTSTTYSNVTPLLTPSVISNTSLEYKLSKYLEAEFSGRYVSQSFLDNTNNKSLVTPSFLIFNLRLRVNLSDRMNISLFINNITNKRYYTSGYVTAGLPYYYVQAPRNYFINLQIKF